MLKLMGKKIFTILRWFFCLSKPVMKGSVQSKKKAAKMSFSVLLVEAISFVGFKVSFRQKIGLESTFN